MLHTSGAPISDKVGYAMGWTVFPFSNVLMPNEPESNAPTGLSHGGRWLGYAALVLFIPERKLGVALLMNSYDPSADSSYFNIGWNIARIAEGLPPDDSLVQEDWLTQNRRTVLVFVIGATFMANVWMMRGARRLPIVLGVAAIEFACVLYLLLVHLPSNNDTLAQSLISTPDIGLMYAVFLGLAFWAACAAGARVVQAVAAQRRVCLLYTSPSPRD